MKTRIVRIEHKDGTFSEEETQALKYAGEIIKTGGLVAFPTETVYGLGGDAWNPESAKKIYQAKGRPSDNPLIVHIARLEDMNRLVSHVTRQVRLIAEAFWPGPVTLILQKSDLVPRQTTGGLDTVAVRMPSDRIAQELIRYGGGYIAAPSANLSGKPSPTAAKYVIEDMDGKIDMILDGGDGEIGLESTIIDLTVTPPQILRPGFITQRMLEEVLGETVEVDAAIIRDDSGQKPRAPGMKYRHYAPKAELVIVEGDAGRVLGWINRKSQEGRAKGERIGVIATTEHAAGYLADVVSVIGDRQDEGCIARNLYRILRDFDNQNVTKIFSESFGTEGFGQAIMNRLCKAAGHQIVHV